MAPKSSGRRRGSGGGERKLGNLWAPLAIFVLLALYLLALNYSRPHVEGRQLRFDQFFSLAQDERIETATILNFDSFVIGTYERPDGSTGSYYTEFLKMGEFSGGASQGFLIDLLLQYEIPFEIDQQYEKNLIGPATLLLPALIIIVVFIYLALSWHQGTGLFSVRSGAKKHEQEATATFEDVAGQERAVSQVRELARFLSQPADFEAVGAKIPRGVLLYGPPGCGKTLLARALAGEAGASFYSISGSDFVELYVGVGASRVRDLFKEARENAPAIIFIDELDSIGRRRGGGSSAASGSREEQEQALNQILAEMDGFSPSEGILLIGATNRPDILDPALLRPGRFDRAIGLERPDEAGREAILRVHAKDKPLEKDVSLPAIAARGVGLTGADLANVVNEAALEAARVGRRTIAQADLERGLTEILEAPERQRRLSMRDRSIGARSLTEDRVTFEDVAGVDEAKVELAEVKQFLDDPDRYVRMGARFPRGLLLVGPPGCGKTLLARAVANEANAAFISASATEFVEVFVGEGPARVRDLFAQARSVPPAIIFIDEIDAIGARREASMDGHREREQTLNQILIELDGFSPRSGVLVIAASNRPEILDPALVRPGRFDRTITLDVPDRGGRRAILDVHARDKPLAPDVDLDAVAGVTRGLSGAELANVMNEAALLATRKGHDFINMAVMDEAIERVALGVARSHILSESERKVIAYHEAGHALVALTLDEEKIPHKVTIVPRGRFLGGSWSIDPHDRVVHSRTSLINEMAIALGGRAAEELIFGEPGSAAADDLSRVGRTARQMVLDLGMSERLGWLSYSANGHPTTHSEETAKAIDDEVRAVVAEARKRASTVLVEGRTKLERIASALMEKETLSAEEIVRLAG